MWMSDLKSGSPPRRWYQWPSPTCRSCNHRHLRSQSNIPMYTSCWYWPSTLHRPWCLRSNCRNLPSWSDLCLCTSHQICIHLWSDLSEPWPKIPLHRNSVQYKCRHWIRKSPNSPSPPSGTDTHLPLPVLRILPCPSGPCRCTIR